MNPSQHAEQFQSQLANYVPQFTPEFWPVWLIIAGVLLVGMWLVLGLHALLRARGVKKSATDHGEKIYLYSKAVRLWHWSNALLFVLLLASGLINHFAMVGATAVKSLVAVHEVCGFLLLACWIVRVEKSQCIGCSYCIGACPYQVRYLNPVTKVADKCDFCAESRLAKGFPPICVSACPEHALIFGREDSPEIQAWLQQNKYYQYQLPGAGKPHLYRRFGQHLIKKENV